MSNDAGGGGGAEGGRGRDGVVTDRYPSARKKSANSESRVSFIQCIRAFWSGKKLAGLQKDQERRDERVTLCK